MPAETDTTRDFVLPDLGEGLEDAVLVEWHVAVGDTVALNQPLCTVETAKATVEIPSPHQGRVVERAGEPGETIAVGARLVRIEVQEGERRTPTLVGYGAPEGPAPARRRRRRHASPGDAAPTAEVPEHVDAARPLAKPPVRRLAKERGIDLGALAPGSGPGGVITRADVERAARAPQRERTAARVSTVAAGDVIPVEGVRARIAEHMARSRATIPDAACSVTIDCGRLLDARTLLRDAIAQRAGADVLTPFVLMLRAVALALRDRPVLNAAYQPDDDGDRIVVHDHIHLGVGTDTPRGLLVPVARDADACSLLDLATEVRRLVDGARAGTLPPADLVGSTFTVSNFGSLGIDEGYPVINHPEVAILGIGAVRPRPVVVDGDVVARPTATFTCSFDHRVCDGADAGAFLSRIRELVEAPGELVVDG